METNPNQVGAGCLHGQPKPRWCSVHRLRVALDTLLKLVSDAHSSFTVVHVRADAA